MKITVRVEVRPTENIEKVRKALYNVFEPEKLEEKTEENYRVLIAEGNCYKSLLKLHSLLRTQFILDAAREYLKRGMYDKGLVFYLNKQAAYVGVVSFCSFEYGESPLGAIVFHVETENPRRLIDWLAPRTINGRPIREIEPPSEDP